MEPASPPSPGLAAAIPPDATAPALAGWADLLAITLAVLAPVVLLLLWKWGLLRPGAFNNRPLRDVAAWPWWFWLLCAFSVVFAIGAGAMMGARTGYAIMDDPGRATLMAMIAVGGALFGLAAGLLLLHLAAQPPHPQSAPDPARAGLSLTPTLRDIKLGLLAIVLTMPIVSAVSIMTVIAYQLITGEPPGVIAHETLELLHDEPFTAAALVIMAVAVFATPIIEEIAFRVFLQSALLRLIGRVWPSVLVASFLFMAVHINAGVETHNWHALPSLFVLGIAMGIAYEWTRRPVVPIVMHIVFNGYNVGLVVLAAT